MNIDNQGIAGIEKWLDSNGLADLHMAGFATDRQQEPVELAVDLRVEHALRDELLKAKEKYKAKAAAGLVSNVRTGEIVAHGLGAGLRSEQSEGGQRSRPASTA